MPSTTDHEKIREAVKKLPDGTKEQAAWEQLGYETQTATVDGQSTEVRVPIMDRHAFREIWLAERISSPKKQETPKDVKPSANSKPEKTDK